MTSHTGRLYALSLALFVFFLAWAILAARPWASAAADPRVKALAVRESRLRVEARLVNEIVARRFAAYRRELRAREAQIAAVRAAARRTTPTPAPAQSLASVRVVTLPPLTITRTS